MDGTNLRLCIGVADSTEPLPKRYLDIQGIQVAGIGDVDYDCGRCGNPWADHVWLVRGQACIVDCSLRPRRVPA